MRFFQSVGIVFGILILIAFAIVTMYASYILGIALLILSLTFIVYYVIPLVKV